MSSSSSSVTRRFIDRDGAVWRVEWRGGLLHFRSNAFGFAVRMSKIDPNDLTVQELERMVDDRFLRNTGGDALDPDSLMKSYVVGRDSESWSSSNAPRTAHLKQLCGFLGALALLAHRSVSCTPKTV